MTIETTDNRINYVGDGLTITFNFPFKTFDAESIKFYEDGEVPIYAVSVSLNADQDTSPGGSVLVGLAPGNGSIVTITREESLTQGVDYVTGDQFPADTHERALDKLTQIDQQQQDEINRSVKASIDAAAGVDYTLPAPVANRAITWNANGDGLENSDTDPDAAANDAAAAAASAAAALVSETEAADSAADALISELAAAASAAGVNLPSIVGGDALRILRVNVGETGYELVDKFRGGMVRRITNQSIADSAFVEIIPTNAEYETEPLTSGNGFAIPVGVTFARFTAHAVFANNATGQRILVIERNGAEIYRDTKLNNGALVNTPLVINTPIIPVIAAEVYTMSVWQDSGGALNVIASSPLKLSVELIQ